jgi:hypothetical protein
MKSIDFKMSDHFTCAFPISEIKTVSVDVIFMEKILNQSEGIQVSYNVDDFCFTKQLAL